LWCSFGAGLKETVNGDVLFAVMHGRFNYLIFMFFSYQLTMCEVARAYGKKIVDIDLTETEHTI
jgi:hypothetical protein